MAGHRQTPEQRRAIVTTAITLALVAVFVYVMFIVMAGLN